MNKVFSFILHILNLLSISRELISASSLCARRVGAYQFSVNKRCPDIICRKSYYIIETRSKFKNQRSCMLHHLLCNAFDWRARTTLPFEVWKFFFLILRNVISKQKRVNKYLDIHHTVKGWFRFFQLSGFYRLSTVFELINVHKQVLAVVITKVDLAMIYTHLKRKCSRRLCPISLAFNTYWICAAIKLYDRITYQFYKTIAILVLR